MVISVRARRAWNVSMRNYDYPPGLLNCHACGQPLDECACVCPFCGERNGCRCCIGPGIATGGD